MTHDSQYDALTRLKPSDPIDRARVIRTLGRLSPRALEEMFAA